MGQGTLYEVWNESGGPRKSLERVWRSSRWSGTGWGTPQGSVTSEEVLWKVWDGSGDPSRGPG